jgi:lipopolysaccharide export LptBFGC system permease protein LptF
MRKIHYIAVMMAVASILGIFLTFSALKSSSTIP